MLINKAMRLFSGNAQLLKCLLGFLFKYILIPYELNFNCNFSKVKNFQFLTVL